MKVNNNAQSTSFGMKLIPPKRIHLSETARYVLYQVNKELAPIRGGNISSIFLTIPFLKEGISLT